MLVREVLPEEKEAYNSVVTHPVQSWEWGEFRQKTGKKVIRLGVYDVSSKSGKTKLISGFQLTVHPIYNLPYTMLYFPRGPMPDKIMLEALKKLGQKENAIFVKMEPNIFLPAVAPNGMTGQTGAFGQIRKFLAENDTIPGRPQFTKYSFVIDLTKSEEDLLKNMKPKTRYNIKVAQKHGVKVAIDNSPEAFWQFSKLYFETAARQKYYGRTPEYYQIMKNILVPAGIEHLFLASFNNETLIADIFFAFNNVLYYPYGSSSTLHRETMPAYAVFWEAIKFAKKKGFKSFDMWGSLGPNADENDPWFGFHRLKEGFGGTLVEYIGTYDLIINPLLYKLFNAANNLRWKLLRTKSNIGL
jgi:lipid II:glycine glycyltransferase (peptidoglycan interpeptide bridge formation enzyme)